MISAGPNPVAVLLCFGLVMPGGPTAVWKSLMGEETLGLRSLGADATVGDSAMILARRKGCMGGEKWFNEREKKRKESKKIGGLRAYK